MTVDAHAQTPPIARLSRRVSSIGTHEDDDPAENKMIVRNELRRQVSNEGFAICESDSEDEAVKKQSSSPIHCLPAQIESHPSNSSLCTRLFPNHLHDRKLFHQHKLALHLEVQLQPLRLILSRLMAHPTLNRKGIFNTPVDPIAMGIPDYFSVIPRPMDFGTVKARLHALAYPSNRQVVDDIRLVLENAMKYNPPQNAVHTAALKLMAFFEDQLRAFCPELATSQMKASVSIPPNTAGRGKSVMFALEDDETPQPKLPQPTSENDASAQGTRLSTTTDELMAQPDAAAPKRRKRGSKVNVGHDCHFCEGRTCFVCGQGCLHLEPTLLICNGFNCAGARIRKGADYYIALDGSRQYCQKCFVGLPPVLANTGNDTTCRYKINLLKRKNDEEVVERWLTCGKCEKGIHAVCALHNEHADSSDSFFCPECISVDVIKEPICKERIEDSYTFASGSDLPVQTSEFTSSAFFDHKIYSADSLYETAESKFIQEKIRERMVTDDFPNAEKTVLVRIISDCSRSFDVPEVIRNHFRMPSPDDTNVLPPEKVNYRSKAIALFQKIDGLDVCIFCMYVQEYDGKDDYNSDTIAVDRKKRVYIAYIDSVEHFQPRSCRTKVYHELLVSYLASARKRGYETAHIWACPPSRGNSFVFWSHPASQRTPSADHLIAWYHEALSRALDRGVVTDVRSLFESEFEKRLEPLSDADMTLPNKLECPPLFDGDFWLEEAVRIHSLNFARILRAKPDACVFVPPNDASPCPAIEVSNLIRDKIMTQPISQHFLRPVNAAALKLKDYHKVVTRPMDLGTVQSKLLLGEYRNIVQVVDDVELVVSNAKAFNPKGNVVHENAIEMSRLFHTELDGLLTTWKHLGVTTELSKSNLSMSLDFRIQSSSDTNLNEGPEKPRSRCKSSVISKQAAEVDLMSGGVDAVQKRMAGNDLWLLDKRGPNQTKAAQPPPKKSSGRKRKTELSDALDEPPMKRRRQSWLAEEVGSSVRRNRTSFFYCSLKPRTARSCAEDEKLSTYNDYTSGFNHVDGEEDVSTIADLRHALLEFSQYRNLEFNTLRHAKYSSAILLYHLHNDKAPGKIPECSSCRVKIRNVRWHRISRVSERRLFSRKPSAAGRKPKRTKPFEPEELCMDCHTQCQEKDEFIPVQVSFRF